MKNKLEFHDISWEEFEAIQEATDKRPNIRIAYCDGIPELWIYEEGELRINLLQDGEYVESQQSLVFPEPVLGDRTVLELVPELVQKAFEAGTSRMLRTLRRELS